MKSSVKSYDWERPKAQPSISTKLRDSVAYEPSITGSSEDDVIGQDSESSEGESSEGTESEEQSSYAPTPKVQKQVKNEDSEVTSRN